MAEGWACSAPMRLYWPSSTQLTGVAAEESDDTLTKASHGLSNGTALFFLGGTGFTGLTVGRRYFVRDADTNTFKLAATSGGSAIDITLDGSAGIFAAAVELADGDSFEGAPPHVIDAGGIAEPLPLWLATDAETLDRGNRRRRFPVSVPHYFASERLAGEFYLDHYDSLARSGWLLFVVGYTGDTGERYARAVLEACAVRWVAGRVVIVDYTFTLGAIAAA